MGGFFFKNYHVGIGIYAGELIVGGTEELDGDGLDVRVSGVGNGDGGKALRNGLLPESTAGQKCQEESAEAKKNDSRFHKGKSF